MDFLKHVWPQEYAFQTLMGFVSARMSGKVWAHIISLCLWGGGITFSPVGSVKEFVTLKYCQSLYQCPSTYEAGIRHIALLWGLKRWIWVQMGKEASCGVLGSWVITEVFDGFVVDVGPPLTSDAVPPMPTQLSEALFLWQGTTSSKKKATGWSLGFSPNCWQTMALAPVLEASTLQWIAWRCQGALINIGAVVKTFLSCEKAWSSVGLHFSCLAPFLRKAVREDAKLLKPQMICW